MRKCWGQSRVRAEAQGSKRQGKRKDEMERGYLVKVRIRTKVIFRVGYEGCWRERRERR